MKRKDCPVTWQAGTEESYWCSSTHKRPQRWKGWLVNVTRRPGKKSRNVLHNFVFSVSPIS